MSTPTKRDLCPPGSTFGRLTVQELVPKTNTKGERVWHARCRCDCGNVVEPLIYGLLDGATRSCGCRIREITASRNRKHGMTGTRLYRTWRNMLNRCNNPAVRAYRDYGARGIAVCSEWSEFPAFSEWANATGYSDSLQIDRKNNNGNYSPDNCRWVTRLTNAQNKRTTLMATHNGVTKKLIEWCDHPESKVPYRIVKQRMRTYGWPLWKAITTPSRLTTESQPVAAV